ncbi:MAG: hypothetical protein MI784_00805 [Cytophagales bacterium]|nr:hypothetical protein [Cytophagales bacterium]
MAYGYRYKSSKLEVNPEVRLKGGQMLLVDDAVALSVSRDEDGGLWYPAYMLGVGEDFWVNGQFLDWPEESDSFRQLMGMFEECWNGAVFRKPDYKPLFDTLQKNLFGHYSRSRVAKGSFDRAEQIELAKEIMALLASRPANIWLYLSLLGNRGCRYLHEDLSRISNFRRFPKYYLHVYGPWAEKQRNGKPFRSSASDIQNVPYLFSIYLNIQGAHLFQVFSDLLPLLEDSAVGESYCVYSLMVSVLRGLKLRPDSLVVRVGSSDGFERVRTFLLGYAREHPDFFIDESLPLTERFAKGMSWSQDNYFSNVWEMDESMLRKVGRFLDRVAVDVADHKRSFSFFERQKRRQEWEEMEKLLKSLQLQWVSGEEAPERVNKDELKRLHMLSESAVGRGAPGAVSEWLAHYDRYQEVSEKSTSFFGLRMQAMADLMEKKIRFRNGAVREMMRIFDYYGIDLYRPYRNCPVKPYRKDEMVVIDMNFPGEQDQASGFSAPEAVFLPETESPLESWGKFEFSDEYGYEMQTFKKVSDGKPESGAPHKVYMHEYAVDEKRRLKGEMSEETRKRVEELRKKMEELNRGESAKK